MKAQVSSVGQANMAPAHARLPPPAALPQRVHVHARPPASTRGFLAGRRPISVLREVRAHTPFATENASPPRRHASAQRAAHNTKFCRKFAACWTLRPRLRHVSSMTRLLASEQASREQTVETAAPSGLDEATPRDGQNGASANGAHYASNGNGNGNGNGVGAGASLNGAGRCASP